MQRFRAVEAVASHTNPAAYPACASKKASDQFGSHVFTRDVMQTMLLPEIYDNVIRAMEGKEKIREEYADSIATAMQEWAIQLGATHFTHWFQPLTGAAAEKHDAFIEWESPDRMIEQFTGKQLVQGEPDASSFPSGGLRNTYEARGYTGWDPSSPVFVWKGGEGLTLTIPSVFFSWTGAVLDSKIPVLRSEKKLADACLRLLKLTGLAAERIITTVGLEQEYFVIDQSLRNLRPDLLLAGRTVFGAASPKGQELQDHYFGSVKERILCFMQDFERAALSLGIPVKTRHNEVAPAQHEVAPAAERASLAIDHNIQLMELMRKIAARHHLSVLLHEKPFKRLNGSGKHCNWSLATDAGINLLDPTETPENNLHFLVLLTAILHAVHRHSELLRASIGSAGNDYRLGGHEAPPAIISVYLGQALEALLDAIEKGNGHTSASSRSKYNLGIRELPDLTKDNTDRNRTSPLAFTGNKFEFRAVGSAQNPAFPISVLNAIVADSLHEMLDCIEEKLGEQPPKNREELFQAVMPVVKKWLKSSKPIRFSGDNYSADWVSEAQKRGLPNIEKSLCSFGSLMSANTIKAFEGILTKQELQSRCDILTEHDRQTTYIEANLMIDLFDTQILPAVQKQLKLMAETLQGIVAFVSETAIPLQTKKLIDLNKELEEALGQRDRLVLSRAQARREPTISSCLAMREEMGAFRLLVDELEKQVDDNLWPLPKYRELLFIV